MQKSVLDWLEKTAEQCATKVAFSDPDNGITFGDVQQKAKAIGTALSAMTATRRPVAVLSGRHVFTPVIFLGVVYAGCFYAPLDGGMPDYRLQKILENLQPELIVADRANEERARSLAPDSRILVAEDIAETAVDEERLAVIRQNAKMTDPLYVIFTSGSSGIPKGVITSQQSLMCYIDAYSKVMGIDSNDIFGNQSPLDYIAAIRDIYLPLKHGASMFIIPKQCFSIPTKLFDILNEQKVTSIGWSVSALTVPTAMGVFKYSKPEYLKKVCFSGSVMPCKYLKIWQENLPDTLFVNQYGPTEATASCTYYVVDHMVEESEVLPIGEAYDNYTVFLLNEDNTETAKGEIGEICVSGPILALGYYNDPERTGAAFVQNPLNHSYRELIYKTGDLGSVRPDGILEFHGRKDRQIKHLGHRVELGEIEEVVKSMPTVQDCIAVYNKEKEQIVLLYVGESVAKEIALEVRGKLPEFMIPRKTIKLDAMPHLPNGKIDMQTLKENYIK